MEERKQEYGDIILHLKRRGEISVDICGGRKRKKEANVTGHDRSSN